VTISYSNAEVAPTFSSQRCHPSRQTPPRASLVLRKLARSWAGRYGMASVFVALALGMEKLLQGFFPYPFLFVFFAAVMASAWFAGTGPGLFAVLLSTIAVDYFFVRPFYSLAINATDSSYFAAFILCALGQTRGPKQVFAIRPPVRLSSAARSHSWRKVRATSR
jgi:K+-sensing histidine kinase KdpD